MQLDPGRIAYDLQNHATNHGAHESPRVTGDALDNLNEEDSSEGAEIESVSTKSWIIVHLGVVERAESQRAICDRDIRRPIEGRHQVVLDHSKEYTIEGNRAAWGTLKQSF